MRSIDDQWFAVFEALGDVEIAAIANTSTFTLEKLDDLLTIQFAPAYLLPREKLV